MCLDFFQKTNLKSKNSFKQYYINQVPNSQILFWYILDVTVLFWNFHMQNSFVLNMIYDYNPLLSINLLILLS